MAGGRLRAGTEPPISSQQQGSPVAAITSVAVAGLAIVSSVALVLLGGVGAGVGTVNSAGLSASAATLKRASHPGAPPAPGVDGGASRLDLPTDHAAIDRRTT